MMTAPGKLQMGFSLLEVLISVVVLAVGLLGLAGLQVNMIRYNHSAQMRSLAIAQVNDMVERMRANYDGLRAGAYTNVSGIPANPGCTVCSTSQIAQLDFNQWNTNNSQMLPSGQGTVTQNGARYVVTLRWDNERTGATGTGCSGNPKVDLTCLSVEVQI